MNSLFNAFSESLHTGFINKSIQSDLIYQPELLVNQKSPVKKVLSTILNELENCQHFYISVAFVTTSGVAAIINKLQELEHKNIKGVIIVSQYLNFTQPEALKRLAQFKNIKLRVLTNGNAHAKCYIFKNNDYYNIIVGSSNLTAQALSTNKEWNIKVSALNESGLVANILDEFETDFQNSIPVSKEYILSYEIIYKKQFQNYKLSKIQDEIDFEIKVQPNSMQIEALRNLKELREQKKTKAILISATGTGKTFLSAFDAKEFNPKKLLFVVHRLTIAKASLKTFQKVFGANRTMGLYSGNSRELDCDFIFSTIQTISKIEHLESFSKQHFDYVIIDESHRSAAESYLNLLNYFQPKFLLGMTATPERTNGENIFKLFDYNIAYEIRLQRALEENMLCPFHYYGVTDLIINDSKRENKKDFNLLVSNERVNKIIEQSNFYGCDNGIVRGLVFCSRREEAYELSSLFNENGFKTIALTSDNLGTNVVSREEAIEKLESENLNDKLDYIFTVDIFNEGIDIPKVNQIILLRPTESAIIFIQQLGRGLRKVSGKSYLTVIDFIGNYANNYLIPIALYGDTSYNKDRLRKLISEGSRMIPGASTINFDQITKERIYQSIDSANLKLFTNLKMDYDLLKFKIGRIPAMMDFIEHGSRDPYQYVEYEKSYYNFVKRIEQSDVAELPQKQTKLLELFSSEINNSKRLEESLILKNLIEFGSLSIADLKLSILNKYEYAVSDETIVSCIANLNFEFVTEINAGRLISAREIYNLNIVKIQDENILFTTEFKGYLENVTFKKYLLDSTLYSIYEFDSLFEAENWDDGFVLYRKYSRKDVFRILNTKTNPVAQNVGGYLVSNDFSNCPVFVNYNKEENISESTKYEDKFISPKSFEWMSKSNRRIESNDVQGILGKSGKIRLPLFIKKSNDEGKDFYFMGEITPDLNCIEQTTIKNDEGNILPIVKILFHMNYPVSSTMYKYLHEAIGENSAEQKLETIKIRPILNIDNDNNENEFKSQIPFYDFYAAAGSFSEMQFEKNYKMIEGPANLKNPEDYFALKIVGESMNRVISNGSICLFKIYKGGSRNGKIVLVENKDIQDQDFHSAYTIKTYLSEKVGSQEGWEHNSIILRPNSYDDKYENIILNQENSSGMRVVGEFIEIIAIL